MFQNYRKTPQKWLLDYTTWVYPVLQLGRSSSTIFVFLFSVLLQRKRGDSTSLFANNYMCFSKNAYSSVINYYYCTEIRNNFVTNKINVLTKAWSAVVLFLLIIISYWIMKCGVRVVWKQSPPRVRLSLIF